MSFLIDVIRQQFAVKKRSVYLFSLPYSIQLTSQSSIVNNISKVLTKSVKWLEDDKHKTVCYFVNLFC